jgi:hypothetical protein
MYLIGWMNDVGKKQKYIINIKFSTIDTMGVTHFKLLHNDCNAATICKKFAVKKKIKKGAIGK